MDPQQAQPRYVQMPDNSYVEWPEGVSAEDFKAKVSGKFGNQPPPTSLTGISSQSDTPLHAFEDVIGNIGGGGLGALATMGRISPWGALADKMQGQPTIYEDAYHALQHPLETGKAAVKAFAEHPLGAVEQGIGAAGATGLAGMGAEPFVPYRSPVVPAAETSAEHLAKAILPQEGVTPGIVKAAMREAPQIRGFAQRTGNPLKTIPEGMKAAEGVAQEGLQHYRTNFRDPYANERVSMSAVPEYQGPIRGEGKYTTLGDIDKRISDINDLIRGSLRTAKSGGQELTAAEKLGLESEGGKLRQILYRELSNRTGVPPEEIQGLREGYGGQYAVKNALESGHYGRLSRSAALSQGQGPGLYPSKAGLIDKALTAMRGGPERIANRQFAKAIRAFEPAEPTYPVPKK